MKKFLIGAAAAAAMLSPAVANAEGSVGVSYLSTDAGGSSNIEAFAIDGDFLLNPNFQLSAHYADLEGGDASYYGIEGFLFTRNDSYGYGGFIGYSSFDGEADDWSLGGFAQLYRGNTNWTVQLGYADTEGEVQVLGVDGEGRFFLSENFSLHANLGFGNIETDFGDGDYWTGGLGAEYQFSGSPISINGGWQHLDADGGEADSLGIGVRWHFGGGSLLDNSRSGASLRSNAMSAIEMQAAGGSSDFTPR